MLRKKNYVFNTALMLSLLSSPIVACAAADLTDLSIEALCKVEVVSANKKKQKGINIPSAIYVISAEDITRTGARSIPEVLKMVPGLNAGKMDSNKWAVGIRGNTGVFSNKLLVMVDGKSVYNPAFSGVYWEEIDVILEDIQQIEVIRGPGGTIWGANAVNGIINVITKQAKNTQGPLIALVVGDYEKANINLRYGAKLGEEGAVSLHGKYTKKDSLTNIQEKDNQDDWRIKSGGFRTDWKNEKNEWSLLGDIHHADMRQADIFPVNARASGYVQNFSSYVKPFGWHLLSHWNRVINDKALLDLKMYYDVSKREELLNNQIQKNFNIDGSINHTFSDKNNLIIGMGVNRLKDDYAGSSWMGPIHAKTMMVYSAFLQDEISFVPEKWIFTLGSKFEHNEYTGFEAQPSARLLWKQDSGNVAWAACSRGVRTPSRIERENSTMLINILPVPNMPMIPSYANLHGQKDFKSETLMAYEVGYRFLNMKKAVWDITGFFNEYDKLRSIAVDKANARFVMPPNAHIDLPLFFRNDTYGHVFGVEGSVEYRPVFNWVLKGAYSELRQNFETRPGSLDTGNTYIQLENDSPKRKMSLLSQYNVNEKLDVDFWLKYSGFTPKEGVRLTGDLKEIPAYFLVDMRLAYKIMKGTELSFVAQNLNKKRHLEAGKVLYSEFAYIPRAYYVKIKYEL